MIEKNGTISNPLNLKSKFAIPLLFALVGVGTLTQRDGAQNDPGSQNKAESHLRSLHEDSPQSKSIHETNLKYFFDLTNKAENSKLLNSLGITVYKDWDEFRQLMTSYTSPSKLKMNPDLIDEDPKITESHSPAAIEYLKMINTLISEDGHLKFNKIDLINTAENLTKGSNEFNLPGRFYNESSKRALSFSQRELKIIKEEILPSLQKSQDDQLDLLEIVKGIGNGSSDMAFIIETTRRVLNASQYNQEPYRLKLFDL